ncbi:HTH-type transcriptional regulator NimR [Burkholderiaceae bacterium]|nr:HTH-type transcriptional regulator NimR [Burkholderiaceae bacterium]
MTNLRVESLEAVDPVERMTRTNASTGRIYFWQGGSLWIGRGRGRTEWHEHHAHQLVVAPEGAFRFRTQAQGRWESFEGALVPSHCAHQFEVDGLAIAHLFVEPESRAGRSLTDRFGAAAVSPLPTLASRASARTLFQIFESTPGRERLVDAAADAVAQLCGATTEPDKALDPRLARALAYIRANIRSPIALGEVAAAVALSESRFRHLFVAQTGSSFRAYLLWLRINLAIEAVMAGASWTQAAHEAGFADSAHLTRTHKRVFGIEPSAIRPQTPGGLVS